MSAAQELRNAVDAALGRVGALLPQSAPSFTLPGPWNVYTELCDALPEHFPSGRGGVRAWLREALHDDPGSTDALPESEATALLCALSALGHTFRWDTVPPAADRFAERQLTLPPGLAGPWGELVQRFDLPRVGSAWTMHLCNWRFRDPPASDHYRAHELTVERLRIGCQWLVPPAAAELERFSLSFVLMEARAGPAVDAAASLVEAAEEGDPHRVADQLGRLSAAMRDAGREFVVAMSGSSAAQARWLELVQPTMAWALPDADGITMSGPNGLQLPSWQLCDAVLGVPRRTPLGQQALQARAAMPLAHRRVLTAADACRDTTRDFILNRGTTVARRRYEEALDAVRRFRTAHRVRAARYLRAGTAGESARVSTGLGLVWRPDAQAPDPVEAFEDLADARVSEVLEASLVGSSADDLVRGASGLLEPSEVARLLSVGHLQTVVGDDAILRTGEGNDALWYIVDGLVRVETHPVSGRAVAIDQLGPGEFFGEISFLTGLPASAWVRAEGDVELVRLDRQDLDRLQRVDAHVIGLLHRSLAVSLALRLRETTAALTEVEAGRPSRGRTTRPPRQDEGALGPELGAS